MFGALAHAERPYAASKESTKRLLQFYSKNLKHVTIGNEKWMQVLALNQAFQFVNFCDHIM